MTDVKEKVLLGGVMQKIHYITDDPSKPVLLFLHGGPGVCNRHDIMTHHRDLLDGGFDQAVRTAIDCGFTHTNFLEHLLSKG